MSHSAETCRRMIQKIDALGEIDSVEKQNTLIRSVMNKEKHAQKVKHELYILWSDYFKPEHFEKFPIYMTKSGKPPNRRDRSNKQ